MKQYSLGIIWAIVVLIGALVAIVVLLQRAPTLPAPFGDTDIHQVQP